MLKSNRNIMLSAFLRFVVPSVKIFIKKELLSGTQNEDNLNRLGFS